MGKQISVQEQITEFLSMTILFLKRRSLFFLSKLFYIHEHWLKKRNVYFLYNKPIIFKSRHRSGTSDWSTNLEKNSGHLWVGVNVSSNYLTVRETAPLILIYLLRGIKFVKVQNLLKPMFLKIYKTTKPIYTNKLRAFKITQDIFNEYAP